MTIQDRFARSLALATDLYQLTMAQGYLRTGLADAQSCFHLYFRKAPFDGAYAIAAGIEEALDLAAGLRFTSDDLDYLRSIPSREGSPLFGEDFLAYLGQLEPSVDLEISAVHEGEVVFPGAPLLRVEGPLPVCQLIETPLLTVVNFQTLIATQARRIKDAAGAAPVLEFGLRRAQGLDGGLSASRAAYIGGADATSNVLAGKLFDIPVRGTHAHSWVMVFGDDRRAFEAYASAMPNNVTLLVDTYDTEAGVREAIAVGLELQRRGDRLEGIRLDSGSLAELAKDARRALDAAGLAQVKIIASNDLDAEAVDRLRAEGAPIDIWGIGTRLVTGGKQAALGGVYKLGAVREGRSEPWEPRIKLSNVPEKSTLPGRLAVRRRRVDGEASGDTLCLVDEPTTEGELLLVPALENGQRVRPEASAAEARRYAARAFETIPAVHRRRRDPKPYPVHVSPRLRALRDQLTAC